MLKSSCQLSGDVHLDVQSRMVIEELLAVFQSGLALRKPRIGLSASESLSNE